jgi:hypothetical protein
MLCQSRRLTGGCADIIGVAVLQTVIDLKRRLAAVCGDVVPPLAAFTTATFLAHHLWITQHVHTSHLDAQCKDST